MNAEYLPEIPATCSANDSKAMQLIAGFIGQQIVEAEDFKGNCAKLLGADSSSEWAEAEPLQ